MYEFNTTLHLHTHKYRNLLVGTTNLFCRYLYISFPVLPVTLAPPQLCQQEHLSNRLNTKYPAGLMSINFYINVFKIQTLACNALVLSAGNFSLVS